MPATRRGTVKQRDKRSDDPNREIYIQETIEKVRSGEYASFRAAARSTKIALSTLTDRAKGRHNSSASAYTTRQLLTPEQEDTLIDRVKHQAEMGLPFSRKDLEAKAAAISGKAIGKSWYKKFLNRHRKRLIAAKAARLDPKRATNTSSTVINDCLDELEAIHARFPGGVPPVNMDERGSHTGAGRENNLKDQKQKQRGSKARLVTSRTLRSESDKEEAERHEREHAAAERDKKMAEDAEHARRIADDALNRVFTGRLGTYKKDDLRALAIAVAVSDKGTNAELLARIEDQFEQYRDLKYNSRFSGIFNKSIRATAQRKGSMVSSNEGRREEEVGALGNPDHPPSAVVTSDSRPPHLRPTIESSSSHQFPPKYHVHRYPPGDASRSELVTPVLHAHPGVNPNTIPHSNTYQPYYYYYTFQ